MIGALALKVRDGEAQIRALLDGDAVIAQDGEGGDAFRLAWLT